MKRLILLGASSMTLWSCTEKSPNIIMTAAADKTDTTYVISTLPLAQPHNILVENFTGTTCSNCPSAHDILHTLETSNPGRLNIMSLYIKNFAQTEPPKMPGSPVDAKYDFRSDIATDILKSVYTSIAAMPTAGMDRLPIGSAATYGSEYLIGRDSWASVVATQTNVKDSINVDVVSTYTSSDSMAHITVTLTYMYNMNTMQSLSIAVVEDGFIDIQENAEAPTGWDTAYHFDNILRGMVTAGSLGDAVLPAMASKEKGRVYKATYNYKVNAAWKPENCRVIAFVHRSAAERGTLIYQSQQAKLKP